MELFHIREDLNALKKLAASKASKKEKEGKAEPYDLEKNPPKFKNGGELRDYQRLVRFCFFFAQRPG